MVTAEVRPTSLPLQLSEAVPWGAFRDRFVGLWSGMGLVMNPGLEKAWKQQHEALERGVARGSVWASERQYVDVGLGSHGPAERWSVVTTETGAGKTQGLALYCSMLPPNVGAMVVVELTKSADEVAATINRLAGDDRAIAVHSKPTGQASSEQIEQRQVVVITHAAFSTAMEALAFDEYLSGHGARGVRQRWHQLERWRGELRQFVVVDETFPVFGFADLNREELSYLLAEVPSYVWDSHPDACRALNFLVQTFVDAQDHGDPTATGGRSMSTRIVWRREAFDWSEGNTELRGAIDQFVAGDLDALMANVWQHWGVGARIGSKDGPGWQRHFSGWAKGKLEAAQALLRRFILFSTDNRPDGPEALFSTSWGLLPNIAPPLTILDATGATNPTYRLLPERIEVLPRAGTARDYSNVKLHVHRAERGVGKQGSSRTAQALVPHWVRAIRKITAEPVLCISHLNTETLVAQHVPESWKTAHWRGFAGSNEFQDMSAVAFLSLPYRNRRLIQLEFNTAQGLQPDEWFSGEESRQFGEFDDVVRACEQRHLAVELVQAINRVRCRRPIDERGGCARTDVFVLLPQGPRGTEILDLVVEQLPGVRVEDWVIDGSVLLRGGKNYRRGFEVIIATLADGKHRVPDIQEQIGCGRSRMKALVKELRTPGSHLHEVARRHGVSYEVIRHGKRNEAVLYRVAGARTES